MKRKELKGEFERLPDAEALLELTCDILTRQSEARSEYGYTIVKKVKKQSRDGRKDSYILQREER